MLLITLESPEQTDVADLLVASDELMAELYATESNHMADAATLASGNARFFVARENARAVGCGAWIRRSSSEGELKRMFVMAVSRGRGVANAILQTIERDAATVGISVMKLETGIRQLEALRLYHRAGYVQCGPFPPYLLDPLSVFMEKGLS